MERMLVLWQRMQCMPVSYKQWNGGVVTYTAAAVRERRVNNKEVCYV